MSDWRVIRHAESGAVVVPHAKWCAGFWCHLKGLMLRSNLPEDEGLLFVYNRTSVIDASIHMLFVFFAIAAIWLDDEGHVVDAKLAKPWRLYYAPARPARYLIEAAPVVLDRVQPGDRLIFDESSPS